MAFGVNLLREDGLGIEGSFTMTNLGRGLAVVVLAGLSSAGRAAQLSGDAKSAIPKDVQQVIVVDYRAMQNSSAAMNLKDRVLPPELKKLESALKNSGLKVDNDADTLAFASFKSGSEATRIVGVAQGQFHTQQIMANFVKTKVKPVALRNNEIYPLGRRG